MKKLYDLFVVVAAAIILVIILWTSYQVALVARGEVPGFAEAGSYYWEVAR